MVTKISPLVVILGETASGKSALGLELARQFNGEIICADSRTIYRGMDIGTAKPSQADQALIPHYLLDVVEPCQKFSAADFKDNTVNIINDINSRNRLPIMIGGSGLYIDSVIFDYKFGKLADQNNRQRLEAKELVHLQADAKAMGITEDQIDFANKRHLLRAIENKGVIKQDQKLRANTLVIGLVIDSEVLKKRITERVEQMFTAGFVDEVGRLSKMYGWDNEAMTGIGYRAVKDLIAGKITEEEAKANFIRGDLLLAKKQRTWFKRNKYVHWLTDPSRAHALVAEFLNKTN